VVYRGSALPKNEPNMVMFIAKPADNLPFKRFLVGFSMSNVGSHVAVDGYQISIAIEQICPQFFCIGPLWNEYIPLYKDCVNLLKLIRSSFS
jgi:hypothetical protein